MKHSLLILSLTLTFVSQLLAQPTDLAPSDVDYDAFMALSDEVYNYRKKRMVSLKRFQKMAQKPGVVILDTRSQAAYEKKHVKGALHLNFSDFSEKKLTQLIPDKTTTILIYCNNNIEGDEVNFARKSPPLALNIPTFINLYGYGYTNLYELADLIPAEHEGLEFERSQL